MIFIANLLIYLERLSLYVPFLGLYRFSTFNDFKFNFTKHPVWRLILEQNIFTFHSY